jgi:hypothetical protein
MAKPTKSGAARCGRDSAHGSPRSLACARADRDDGAKVDLAIPGLRRWVKPDCRTMQQPAGRGFDKVRRIPGAIGLAMG